MTLVLTTVLLAVAGLDAGSPSVAELETGAMQAYDAKNYGACARDFTAAAERVRGARNQRADWYSAACCEALNGRPDAALADLERANGLGLRDAFGLSTDTDLASLAKHPRFLAVVEKVAARDRTPDPDLSGVRPPQAPKGPVRCQLSAAEKEALLGLDFWQFDQSPNGWRQFPKDESGRAAQANDEACERLTLDLVETYAARYAQSLTASELRMLRWHAGQVAGFLGDAPKALAYMKQTMNSTPEWNAYVRASIAFLEHDRARLQAEREVLAAQDTDLRMRVNLRIVDSFLRCLEHDYRAAYLKTCQPESPSDLIRSLAVKVEPQAPLPQGVVGLLSSKKAVFVAGDLGVEQVPQLFSQLVGTGTGRVGVVLDVEPATQRAVERSLQSKGDEPLRKDQATHGNLAPLLKQLATMPQVTVLAGSLSKLDVAAQAKSFDRLFVLTTAREASLSAEPCRAACETQKALGDGQVFSVMVRHEKGSTWACTGPRCGARPVKAAPAEYATAVPWDHSFYQEDKPVDGMLATLFVRQARAAP